MKRIRIGQHTYYEKVKKEGAKVIKWKTQWIDQIMEEMEANKIRAVVYAFTKRGWRNKNIIFCISIQKWEDYIIIESYCYKK